MPEGTRWPSGDSVDLAVLPMDENELVSRLGLPLLRGVEDGLGPWAAIGGTLPSGTAVEFIHHALAPEPRGVVLRADKVAPYAATLDEALQAVGLARHELLWISPFLNA
jgi:hypothetical protein